MTSDLEGVHCAKPVGLRPDLGATGPCQMVRPLKPLMEFGSMALLRMKALQRAGGRGSCVGRSGRGSQPGTRRWLYTGSPAGSGHPAPPQTVPPGPLQAPNGATLAPHRHTPGLLQTTGQGLRSAGAARGARGCRVHTGPALPPEQAGLGHQDTLQSGAQAVATHRLVPTIPAHTIHREKQSPCVGLASL